MCFVAYCAREWKSLAFPAFSTVGFEFEQIGKVFFWVVHYRWFLMNSKIWITGGFIPQERSQRYSAPENVVPVGRALVTDVRPDRGFVIILICPLKRKNVHENDGTDANKCCHLAEFSPNKPPDPSLKRPRTPPLSRYCRSIDELLRGFLIWHLVIWNAGSFPEFII